MRIFVCYLFLKMKNLWSTILHAGGYPDIFRDKDISMKPVVQNFLIIIIHVSCCHFHEYRSFLIFFFDRCISKEYLCKIFEAKPIWSKHSYIFKWRLILHLLNTFLAQNTFLILIIWFWGCLLIITMDIIAS